MEKINIGLEDREGKLIFKGCFVKSLTKIGPFRKGTKFRCVWNVPQHRFGFDNAENTTPNDETIFPNCSFYATPRNVKKIKII